MAHVETDTVHSRRGQPTKKQQRILSSYAMGQKSKRQVAILLSTEQLAGLLDFYPQFKYDFD